MTGSPQLLLVAHGTRDSAGIGVLERLAEAVAATVPVPVRLAYVDVLGPSVTEVLAATADPVVVVPAFLARGYHVRHDLPEQVAASGHDAAVIAGSLGPSSELATVMLGRLRECGWRPGDPVLFSAAGSRDEQALADVRTAAGYLERLVGCPVFPSHVTTAPRTGELVASHPDAVLAPYLLAPGEFHRRLAALPAREVAGPLGAHPAVVNLVVRRYHEALTTALLRDQATPCPNMAINGAESWWRYSANHASSTSSGYISRRRKIA